MTEILTNIKDFLGFTFWVGLAFIMLYLLYTIGYNCFYWMTNQKVPEEGMYVIQISRLESLDHAKIDLKPNLRQVKQFLRKNEVDKRKYNITEYNCEDFSEDFVEDFMNTGFFSCTTDLTWYNETGDKCGHQIVTIKTEERGIIFVEPQEDKIYYDLDIGDNYWGNEIVKLKSCFEHKEMIK